MKNRKQNCGMTLIELLVTIAIIAVVTTVGVIGINLLMSGDSKKASRTIQDKISEVRTNTLSIAKDWEVSISNEDDSYYVNIYEDDTLSESVKLGSKIDITYTDLSGEAVIPNGNELVICFARASGVVADIFTRPTGNMAEESNVTVMDTADTKMKISVNSTTKGMYEVELWYATGKITGQQ